MDSYFIEWLRTSISGIIILGALGSILSVGLLKLTAYCIARWGSPAKNLAYRVLYYSLYGRKIVIEHLKGEHSTHELLVTIITLGVFNIIMTIFLVTGLIIVILGAINIEQNIELSLQLTFFGSFFVFTSGFMSISSSRHLYQIYTIFMGNIEKSAIDKAIRNRGN
ncbi:hypothetical protein [Aeromonas hydrophila]|uniref:hypothetical protein n=1 Tax=Aeromonas hydrophila TaxID=644 RepID=UPI002B4A1F59|nr:hypothetical protein [Aeromonas hydrophila]